MPKWEPQRPTGASVAGVTFSRIEANNDATKPCKWGRTIVTYRGSIYGTLKG